MHTRSEYDANKTLAATSHTREQAAILGALLPEGLELAPTTKQQEITK